MNVCTRLGRFHNLWHTMHTTNMHRHCGLHQLCVTPLHVSCSLDNYILSSKRIRYFDWSRWLLAPELSIGAELVRSWSRVGPSFAGAGYKSWESGSLPEPRLWELRIWSWRSRFRIGLGGFTKKTWFRIGTGSKRFNEDIRIKENNKTYGQFKLRWPLRCEGVLSFNRKCSNDNVV